MKPPHSRFSQIEVPNQMWWELSDVQLINVQPSKQQLVWRVEICFIFLGLNHLQMTDFNGKNVYKETCLESI